MAAAGDREECLATGMEDYATKPVGVDALVQVEMYLAGVSVRRVEDITEALWGTRVSSVTLSRLNQKIYAGLTQTAPCWARELAL